MFRFYSAGESHGKEVLAFVEGIPAGLSVDVGKINAELKRRQGGYGRGGRQRIEQDEVDVVAGLRRGVTLGSPVVLKLANKDAKIDTLHTVDNPRPGHGDLAGSLKYGTHDARDVLERASARETAARVMAGALARQVLATFHVEFFGFVQALAGFSELPDLHTGDCSTWLQRRDASEFYMIGENKDKWIKEAVNKIAATGDTLGGLITVLARGLPVGIGNHTQWDLKMDGRLAQALMSIPAIKGVEIGAGFQVATLPGSQVHDEIYYKKGGRRSSGGFYRKTNRAGGLEAGITNGEDIVIHLAMKPISTLRPPIQSKSVNLKSKEDAVSTYERADITAVPAASVVAENMVALVCCAAFLEKFGADSMVELSRHYYSYLKYLQTGY